MCISGRPPTGRTWIRSPEMSVTLGATTTWTSAFSRSQTIRRSWPAEVSAPPAKKMTSASDARITEVACSQAPTTGMPAAVSSRRSRGGHQGADDVVAEPGLAAQHGGDLVDVLGRAGDQHAVLQPALAAGAVHGLRGAA